MAQYQILARKLLGPPGTGPKRTIEVKNSVATPPRVRRTAAPTACTACGTLQHAARGTAGHRHCSYTQLQCRHAHATVPPCARYSAVVRTLQCRLSRGNRHFTVDGGRLCQSGPRPDTRLLRQPALEVLTRSARTDSPRQVGRNNFPATQGGGGGTRAAAAAAYERREGAAAKLRLGDGFGSGPTGPGPTDEHSVHLHHRDFIVTPIADRIRRIDSVSKTEYYEWLRNHNSGLAQRIMYGPFNPYIPIRSTIIGKSRVAKDPIVMRTSWRSNSDIASVTSIGYPRMSASGESSTTMHRLLHASGSHPISPPDYPKKSHSPKSSSHAQHIELIIRITDSACKNQLVVVSIKYGPFNPYIPIRSTTIGKSRVAKDPIAMRTSWRSNSDIAGVTRVSMMFRVVRTNQYNQDLGLIHSTNGNHLESPNEGSSIDHQVTIYLHAQNITMFPTNETWYFASQILVSISGGLILISTAQSTRNMFRIHSDY
ncbi:Tau class glutathione S-transferase [Dorcoceras hygrometricum]|uniref:Tau class glutathione S-transferase n=1 Tax=Dorcoceras hygrometricum TaxID=472368 RepID=A0A2Z7B7B9_9LAMI|nr:Tau class glutathione S-transferase [Dorcoceras hygrometricum]